MSRSMSSSFTAFGFGGGARLSSAAKPFSLLSTPSLASIWRMKYL